MGAAWGGVKNGKFGMEVVKDPAGSIPLKSRGENSSSQSLWEGWKQLEEELDEGFTAAICTLGIKSLQNPPFFIFPVPF